MHQTVKQVNLGSTQGRNQTANHSNTVHQTGSTVSCHGGHHQAHHGGHHQTHHGGHQQVHHGGHHQAHHGGHHQVHHEGHHQVHHGGHHQVHHGGHHQVHHGGHHQVHHGGHHQAHHGRYMRAPSVHGGSGGKGISLSRHFSHGHSFGSVYGYSHGNHFTHQSTHGVFDGLLCFNEKETMQLLNNRLATYMEKVCSLEQENSHLEGSIREWYEKNQPDGLPDCSKYYRTIQELQSQIPVAYKQNAKVFLDMDNAKLAADDFRNKCELEMSLRSSVEADVKGLHRVLERLNIELADLQMQVCDLQEELQDLKKTHEEEVNCLRTHLGARVSVEVNAAPCKDLNKILSEIRQEYENLMERNLKEVEDIFLARSEELNHDMVFGAEELQTVTCDLIELKRNVQTLEIDLQSQLSVKSALENSLAETEANYGFQLAQIQCLINNVELELEQIRFDLENQNIAYKILMDQKNHLEMEIATYKRLLDGHDIHAPVHNNSTETHHAVKVQFTTSQVHQAKC